MRCPAPRCTDVYAVEAGDVEDAVRKLVAKLPPPGQMPPMSPEQREAMVRKRMAPKD